MPRWTKCSLDWLSLTIVLGAQIITTAINITNSEL